MEINNLFLDYLFNGVGTTHQQSSNKTVIILLKIALNYSTTLYGVGIIVDYLMEKYAGEYDFVRIFNLSVKNLFGGKKVYKIEINFVDWSLRIYYHGTKGLSDKDIKDLDGLTSVSGFKTLVVDYDEDEEWNETYRM